MVLVWEALVPDFGVVDPLVDCEILSSFSALLALLKKIVKTMHRLVVLVFLAPFSEVLFPLYHPLDSIVYVLFMLLFKGNN